MKMKMRGFLVVAVTLGLSLSGCGEVADVDQSSTNDQLALVATTSIVGDVVQEVAGDVADVTVLMPPGSDAHAHEADPQDATAVADADVIFVNGLGLGEFDQSLQGAAPDSAQIVEVSEGVEPILGPDGSSDPHVWWDPISVITWVRNIEGALTASAPDSATVFRENADAYVSQLEDLDAWIREQVALVPENRRLLIADHQVMEYFARRYGFETQSLIPAVSTQAQPSARDLARIEDSIAASNAPAIFVGVGDNRSIADMVAEDTGVEVHELYHGSLTEPGGPADSYEAFMRTNVERIVAALRPE